MAKVTSKLQVTIPKKLADRYAIRPGDDIEWLEAGEAMRVVPAAPRSERPDPRRRVELFDAATARQRERQAARGDRPAPRRRGWRREDLYRRGRAG
jgi:bifunctional DNA-binding transcriptional regulator/antitoxin component of YhaV-PrlF toxin-antitoxin module